MHISVLGTGYVGLVTGACFAEFGLTVTCMDMDAARVEQLTKGHVPFYEPGLAELTTKGHKAGRLSFTTDFHHAVDTATVIFIAVGTPSRPDGSPDLSAVDGVARSIGQHMTGYKVVATKSTVPVGTATRVRDIITEQQTKPVAFDVASNPEFLREGSAINDFMRPDRVVIGTDSERATAILKELYRPLYLIETPFIVTNVQTAEMIKYASNAFLATKISFINEVANLCECVNADVQTVAKAMGLDKRIGAKFLHAGAGYGGSCLGKDAAALVHTGSHAGSAMPLTATTQRVNAQQRVRMVEKIRDTLHGVQGKTIALLGLSFKPNTDDVRDAPALVIAAHLLREGCTIRAYDPEGMEGALKAVPGLIGCNDAYDAMKGADAVVLATEWNQFRNLDLARMTALLRTPVMIDLRNVYDPERIAAHGIHYVSVGRPSAGANPFQTP